VAARRKLSEVRKVQILEAAVHVIGERGFSNTRIADIASRAGTSSALVIYYFESKDRLLAEALSFSEEHFFDATARELDAIDSARDRMIRLLELSCSQSSTDRDWLEEWLLWVDLWALSARDPVVAKDREAMERRWRDTIADIVRLGQRRGEFDSVDPDDFALRLGALIDGLAVQVVLNDPDVDSRRMFDLCVGHAAKELGFEPPRARSRRRPPRTTAVRPEEPAAAGRRR
jgi:AcrR family transcriptional regulator